ncbi:Ref family protein [Entomomonas sp. E2T0]|uniref:Ref family protein n=1 Tax=Entomomonas sp. E2T0 TaxID=2930213 RepID=UPI0022284360|nr:Ref family protein [Entomomonas sp. E2T0]UYZ85306.1 Ref family protein [Entomomonas sp. E2T0]
MIQGRSVTDSQKRYWDNLAQFVGCIACIKEGKFNNYCSIHHIEGRTKKNAHWLVLPLCAGHHQDNGTAIAIHPYKKQFEQKYGNQYQLIVDCITLLKKRGVDIPENILTLLDSIKGKFSTDILISLKDQKICK